MKIKVIHRYINVEILRVFFLTLGLFIFIVLMDRASTIAKTVLGQGISLLDFLSVLTKGIPSILGITIPMSFILAVLIVFIQLENNNELVALKSCGISVKELSKPVFFIGTILSLFAFFSLMFIMPKSNVAMKKEIEKLIRKKITLSISSKSFVSNFPGVTFYAEKVYPQEGYLENFMVSLLKKEEIITIFAKKGILRTKDDTVFLDIQDGTAQVLDWKKPESVRVLDFKNYTVKLYKFREKEKFSAPKYKTLTSLISTPSIEAKVEIFKRISLALAPLILGVLAFSFGVSLPRGSLGVGILVAVFSIVVFYVLYTFSEKMAYKNGIPLLSLLPDFIFLVFTAFLYNQAIKEKVRLNIGGRW